MFAKFFTIASLAILAAATPTPGGEPASSCSTGPVQCCDSTAKANSAAATSILDSIGVVVQDVNALVGLDCSPISVVGVGAGNVCSAEAVCCQDNSHGTLISIGCLPVTL
ncbi:hydrophobin [Trametes versicolor FP-101664 SS1]|uniref:hydrophobin n=1 Tax=Trametes versicolor (strain FP-101664) TaxID=717944 RepID=UPI0004622922|nr:hydrophobin [Trametes versicolor FP-101664 SS1]EIW52195.1 hydrophobin [Trametes versicolor FP-101664 SS1]